MKNGVSIAPLAHHPAKKRGGGVLEWVLGRRVPPRPPKLDPVLEGFYIQSDTPF